LKRFWLGLPASLALFTLLGSGCQSIIGIEDRTYDERAASTGGRSGGSTGGAGNNAGNSSGGTAQIPADVSPACREYCELAKENCTNECNGVDDGRCPKDYKLYPSDVVCWNVCKTIEELELDDPDNTIACRIEEARNAGVTGEVWTHCPAAGPGGAGVCGDNCESYCSMMDVFCGADEKFAKFTDPDCVAKCRGLRDADTDEIPDATASAFGEKRHHDGDSVQCRLVHVSNASASPSTHCWHAALAPKPDEKTEAHNPCADEPGVEPRCRDYCKLIAVACQGDLAVYEPGEQCEKACEALDPGDSTQQVGVNSIGCRRNHTYNAMLGGADKHCTHAGPAGEGVCGDNCESYCTLLKAACGDDFTTDDECVEECQTLDGSAPMSPYAINDIEDGNNFQCRLRAAVRAFVDPKECESAIGSGNCQD
jgi:hypothetical protein